MCCSEVKDICGKRLNPKRHGELRDGTLRFGKEGAPSYPLSYMCFRAPRDKTSTMEHEVASSHTETARLLDVQPKAKCDGHGVVP